MMRVTNNPAVESSSYEVSTAKANHAMHLEGRPLSASLSILPSASAAAAATTTLNAVTTAHGNSATLRNLVNRSASAPTSYSPSSTRSRRVSLEEATAAFARKSASDSLLQPLYRYPSNGNSNNNNSGIYSNGNHHSKMMHHSYYDNKNTTFMMIHRSGGSTVKKIIPMIHERCQAAEDAKVAAAAAAAASTGEADEMDIETNEATAAASSSHLIPPSAAPEEECYLLSQWAVDSYYKVVIGSNGGLVALLRAMHCFPDNLNVQEYACWALAHLCTASPSHQHFVVHGNHESGTGTGLTCILHAMQRHGHSVAVMSAACEALRILAPTWLAALHNEDTQQPDPSINSSNSNSSKQDFVTVLQSIADMYLHLTHKRTAQELLKALGAE